MIGLLSKRNRQLWKVANYLCSLPICFACEVEGQPQYCETDAAKEWGLDIKAWIRFDPFPTTKTLGYIHTVAGYLKKFPMCLPCILEGQQHCCESINIRWAGREILRILDRPGWVTKKLR